jgi:glycosyltransferase involved in cell wall biosynthesis
MISIVVPVYNERDNLVILHNEIKQALNGEKYEIIYVDDGSRDGSFELLNTFDNCRIIKFRKNFGQTAALDAGFHNAKGQIIVSLDSDLQNDPSDIPGMIRKLKKENWDVVCGWRKHRKDTISKRLFSLFAGFLRRNLIGDRIHDSGCTLRVYKKECFDELKLYGEAHRYIPALLRWKGFKVSEIITRHRQRKFGKTKYGYGRLMKGFLDLLNVWFWRKYSARPLHLFGGLGMVATGLGSLGIFYSFYLWVFKNIDLSNTFLPVASGIAVIAGIQLLVSGVLADISAKQYFETSSVYSIEKVIVKK